MTFHRAVFSPHVVALAACLWLVTPLQNEADAQVLRLHAQGHGTLLSGGGGDYFEDDAARLGGGLELGAKVLFLLATADVNIFGTEDGERIYWNQLMGGIEIGLPMPFDRIELRGRAQVGYVSATFSEPHPETESRKTGGLAARVGANLQFRLLPAIWAGFSGNFGAHHFGSDRDGGGAHVMTNLYLRVQLGL